jgi:methionyl-tRNA synthetase
LANLGNLCNRVLKYSFTNYKKQIPKIKELTEADNEFIETIKGRYEKYKELLNQV